MKRRKQKPWRKKLLVAGMMISLVFLAFLLMQTSTTSHTVRITDDGFDPAELLVYEGDVVIFENVSSSDKWPASNSHPVHDEYPEFDSQRPLSPGQSWEFSDARQGTWLFHDHIDASMRGTLRVEPSRNLVGKMYFALERKVLRTMEIMRHAWRTVLGKPDGAEYGLRFKRLDEELDAYVLEMMGICAPFGNRHPCYKDITNLFLKQFEISTLFHSMKRNEQAPEIYSHCHTVGHYVGRRLFHETRSINDAYQQCEVMVCGVGCHHGVAEEFFRENRITQDTEDEIIINLVQSACGNEDEYDKQILYHECLHGIGHGLMTFTAMDLPRALRLCDGYQREWDREGCYGGVFMENSTSFITPEHESKYVDVEDPLYPCNILDAQYQKICYEYQTSYFGGLTNWDWDETREICLQIPSEFQDLCFSQIAAHKAMTTYDYHDIKSSCDDVPSLEVKNKCIEAVVSTLGGRNIDDPEVMLEFCRVVDEPQKEVCYRQLGGMVSYWGKNEKQRDVVCDEIGVAQYEQWCKEKIANERFQ